MDKTKIEWCDSSWNPFRGCTRVSEGCRNCYAEGIASRFGGAGQPYESVVKIGGGWNGEVRLVVDVLTQPLRWRRPRRIFVNSMSDTFHESISNAQLLDLWAVFAACPQHTFLVLTKRPARMREWFRWVAPVVARSGRPWPLPNVWLGVSVENQRAADERIQILVDTPAARHFLSVEPLLEAVDLDLGLLAATTAATPWVIVGGESGHGARPCEVSWIADVVSQCHRREIDCFVKQLGSHPLFADDDGESTRLYLTDPKGGDPTEWPEGLHVRQIPS